MFDTYYSPLCIYVKKLAGDIPAVEDIVQDVLINIWIKRDELNINRSLKNYLYKSVHNGFLQHIRKEKIEFTELDKLKYSILIEKNLTEDEPEDNSVKIKEINSAIEKLPPKCKKAFKLSRFENLKYKEIAANMNISQKTVEIHISKALAILRKVQLFWLLWFL
ncbi:MAG: RNA polymerase sigma-70 factor [Bacteroidota bacterium]